MSQRYSRLRTALVVSILSAGIVLGAAQAGIGETRAQDTPSPVKGAPGQAASAPAAVEVSGSARVSARRSRYPIVNDPRLTASPAERFVGPAGSTNPFGGTAMTENQCRDMERCQVVQGQGPSYATWCRCGKGKLTTFTYIHD